MKTYTRGFTLIELLVVIAIIGILSSVVLVSLNSARSKGKDARISTDISQLRTQIETDSDGSTYNAAFSTIPASSANADCTGNFKNTGNYLTIRTDLTQNSPGSANVTVRCASNGTAVSAYALYGTLNTGPNTNNYFCLASNGSTAVATSTNTAITCN